MTQEPTPTNIFALERHTIIAGFGVPGRAIAELLSRRQLPYCVIEMNEQIVERCLRNSINMIHGDVRDPKTLLQAGIDKAAMLVLAIPVDTIVLPAIQATRQLNPTIYIVARCHFTSIGMQATQSGANDVIVAEQAVAREITQIVESHLNFPRPQIPPSSPPPHL